jgi:hypothetical protein
MQKRSIIAGFGIAAILCTAGATGAHAAGLIGSKDIKNGSVRGIDIKNGTVSLNDLSTGVKTLLGQGGHNGQNGQNGQNGANAQGEKGDTGAQGEQGKTGAAGADGTNGVDGKDGANGIDGTNGVDGAPGADGANGADGKDGIAGLYYVHAKYGTTSGEDFTKTVNQGAIATVACKHEGDVAISGGVQTLGLGGSAAAVASSFPGRMDWDTMTPRENRLDGWIVQFDSTRDPVKADLWVLCAENTSIPVLDKVLS